MTEDSAFFDLRDDPRPSVSQPELIHRSEKGWAELYRVERDGKFRVWKVISPKYRGQYRYEGLLRKEFEIGYSLDHPSIRSVYAFGHSETFGNYIEMEWVDGCSLAAFLESHKPDAATSRRLVLQLCDALSYLHSRQIIHRDLKPANILITHNGLNLKLIDFGLSDSDSHAVLKAAAGTASYAAPELLAGESADCRADIFSLGRIIALLMPARRGVIRRCTAARKEQRYPDAAAVAAAIRRGSSQSVALGAVALLVVAGLLFVLLARRPTTPVPDPAPDAAPESVITDPAAIDELFRQATEMILSGEDQ